MLCRRLQVYGLDNLLTAVAAVPLAFCSSFSSVAAFIGSPGQANYAAANSVLDAHAAAMQASGLPGTGMSCHGHTQQLSIMLFYLRRALAESYRGALDGAHGQSPHARCLRAP